MGYYTYISNSQYAAKDTALYNRLNGVSGHTFLGTFLVSNTTNIFGMAAQLIGGKDSNKDVTGPDIETENANFQEQSKKRTAFNAALKAFNKQPNNANAKALTDAYANLKDNKISSKAYNLCKKNHPNLFNKG